eukprot:Clim_evm14s50 gene=Clim_evmTU14s50
MAVGTTRKVIRTVTLGLSPWQTQDPFLFCVHHRDQYPQGNPTMGVNKDQLYGRQIGMDFELRNGFRMYHGERVPGFPHHPHRGFETITVVKEGYIDHSDSLGAKGRFSADDTQWMTAGKGVQHSEMFPLVHADKDNPLELFQIWLNLPRKSKMVDPHYKMLWREELPRYTQDNGKTVVDVIAGELHGVKALEPTPSSWAADPASGVAVFIIKLAPGASITLPKATIAGVNRSLYHYRGGDQDGIVHLDCSSTPTLKEYGAVELVSTEDLTVTNPGSERDANLLLLQGKPIGEPVAKRGPFVMNTQEEIMQAFADYQRTQFGGWPWDGDEITHGRKPRFALYPNGTEEYPGGTKEL